MQNTTNEKRHIQIEFSEFVPKLEESISIVRKITGTASVIAVNLGENISDELSPFNAFIQVVNGGTKVSIKEQLIGFKNRKARAKTVLSSDLFLEITGGDVEVVIDQETKTLGIGESIIIPAQSELEINANDRFKMISITQATIKSSVRDQ